jgi:predicted ATPase
MTKLKSIKIDRFRCFKRVEVPLGPLTVLVGPNDTGKSAFLDAIAYLGKGKKTAIVEDFHRRNANKFSIVGAVNGTESQYVCENHPSAGLRETETHPIGVVSRFRLPTEGIQTVCDGFQGNEHSLNLMADGSRTAALFDHLLRTDLDRFMSCVERIRELVPGFEKLVIATPSTSKREIELVVESGLKIPASKSSAGVRLLLFFLALAYHPLPPDIVLLEEPESGIHPKRLEHVMALLHLLSRGELGGKPAQVILTTHSPYLLDFVDLDTDQVLVFRREEDGSRVVQPADAEKFKNDFDGFMLGEVWFNEREEGLLGGGPK